MLERSARAYQSWRTTAKDERAKVLLRVAGLYKDRIDAPDKRLRSGAVVCLPFETTWSRR